MAIVLKSNDPQSEAKIYPVAAIREGVVFPHVEMVLTFGRSPSITAVNEAVATDGQVIFLSQKRASVADPKPEDLYTIGVLAKVERTLKTNQEVNALIKGISRVKIQDLNTTNGYLQGKVTLLPETFAMNPELEALAKHLLNEFKKAVNLGKSVEFLNFMKLMAGVGPDELTDQIAATLDASTAKKQIILETLDLPQRIQKVVELLTHEVKVLEIEHNIASKTQKKFDKNMRDAVLRERLKTIQKELGEAEDDEDDIKELKRKLAAAKMPADVRKKVEKEIQRFSRLNIHSPEYSYIQTWLDAVLEMPWSVTSKNHVSMKKAETVLENDHYGLKDVKERIIEYLAVLELKKQSASEKNRKVPTIICFVGPPGVGKTSIGKSIAKALNRKFVKISLGGIRDEAEIRGHRRTYVGAMPGRIIQGIRTAGTKNPVFMLDEIDKVGTDFRGDPSSALLEALDPEQNSEFSDHYLEIPFDLSDVIFITTANVLDTIPPALRDRLEVIEFSGYTQEEKFEIVKRHLLQKTISANGLSKDTVSMPPKTITTIINDYTREAGVRNLEREIAKVMRKVAKKITTEGVKKAIVNPKDISKFLGPVRFSPTNAEKKQEPGLATGLAWTQVGGDIIFIEVAIMPGTGQIILTGKLGEVMQESAKAAWSYVRTRWEVLRLPKDFYKHIDVHIHVPEGAVPKDGPSAGVTIATAIVSALTKKRVKNNIGMTGEITLRGRVLEIGGVKEKVIAGRRAGLSQIILPKANKKDVVEVPDTVKKEVVFHFADHMDQILKLALAK
jgi:ATP-dependent Lon protease